MVVVAIFGAPKASSACMVKCLDIDGNAAVKSYRMSEGSSYVSAFKWAKWSISTTFESMDLLGRKPR